MWKCCVQSGNSEQAMTSNRILRSEGSIPQNLLKKPDRSRRTRSTVFRKETYGSVFRATQLRKLPNRPERHQSRWRHRHGPDSVPRTTLDRTRSCWTHPEPAEESCAIRGEG